MAPQVIPRRRRWRMRPEEIACGAGALLRVLAKIGFVLSNAERAVLVVHFAVG
jgi:hypothetical protein